MNDSLTFTAKKVIEVEKLAPAVLHQTFLFNCYCHLFDEVVEQISKAIGCSYDTASKLTHTAETFGNVAVFAGSYEECVKVANILGTIGLEVNIT